ncbi:MAG: archaellin/type IV pilin N-terminal domain-containing protein [Candidatus Heimdallarchaeota archaeon]
MARIWDIGRQKSRIRAISPVIATVLMIGLVVVAGLGVALVIFGTVATPTPINVDVIGISEFESTDNNILVDRFRVTLQNTESSVVLIQRADAFEVRDRNFGIIPGWRLNLTQDLIPLRPLQILTLPISLDRNIPSATELIPENDTIYVHVTVYPEGSKFIAQEALIFQSDLLAVGDTLGPVYLSAQTPSTEFDTNGINLLMNIVNNGSTNLNLLLEITSDSPSHIFFTIDSTNSSQGSLPVTLQKYQSTSLSGVTIKVNADPARAVPSALYQIFITLKDQNSPKSWDIVRIYLTYQP